MTATAVSDSHLIPTCAPVLLEYVGILICIDLHYIQALQLTLKYFCKSWKLKYISDD